MVQVNMVSVFFIVSSVFYLCLISTVMWNWNSLRCVAMKSDRDRCTQKCENLNGYFPRMSVLQLENHEFISKSLLPSIEHHAKETCQKCILFFYEGYRTSSQKGRARIPEWCTRFGSHCPSTMEGTYTKQKVVFLVYLVVGEWFNFWNFLIHDFFLINSLN